MKYRDLKISFSIGNIFFNVISLSHEKIIKPYPRHAHSKNSYELHFVPQGQGTLVIENKKYDITPGTLFMTGPEVPHEQISARENPMTEFSIYLQVQHSASQKIPPESQKIPSLVKTFLECSFWFGQAEQSIYSLTEKLFEELKTKDTGYELMVQTILPQLILSVARHYLGTQKTKSAPQEVVSGQNRQTVSEKAYLIIEEAFLYDYKTITLTELARRVSLSERQTERLLVKHYGQSFIQKKTEARMSAASQLLCETNTSVAAIAEDLGYSSAEHFCNAFRKYYKISPRLFRINNSSLKKQNLDI